MKRKKGIKLALWGVASVFVLAGLAVGYYYLIPKPQRVDTTTQQPAEPKPVSLTASTLFLGDVYWGRYMNDWSMKSSLKTAYPFSRLNEFDRESYDAWIANLECPTVAGFSQASIQEDTTLSFNCSPDYLPEVKKWFTAVSLANNHTDNRGADGFTETKQQLDKNGIQYFGHYDPAALADVCEVIALPVTVTYDNDTTKKQAIPIALCGYHGVFKIPSADSIAQIKKYAALMPVIAMPHMGAEYQTAPDALRQTTYRAMIDAGADVVLGNHPHWVQSTESYKGKLIVYSMGNFIFDQQANREVTRSAAIRVVLNTTNATPETLAPWLELGKTCETFKDGCLTNAQDEQLSPLNFTYQFSVVGTNSANKITKPATSAEEQQIKQRLNWDSTMKQLQVPQSSL